MAKMYIANCTNYRQIFGYRIPGATHRDQGSGRIISDAQTLFELIIPPRGQEMIPHDLPAAELEMIAEAHQMYGLINDRQVHNVKGFNGLIYKIGSPVDMERIEHVAETNLEHLEKQVDERMKIQLVAADHAVKSELGEESARVNQIEVVEVVDETKHAKGGRKSAVMEGKQDQRGR